MAEESDGVGRLDLSKMRRAGDPAPEPSPQEVAAADALQAEYSQLRDARLAVLDAWNLLENSLVEVLRSVVGTPDPVIAATLYFTPQSFRTRLETISKIIDHLVMCHAVNSAFSVDWEKIADKLRRRRTVRNLAAHGHIISYAEPNGKNSAVLAPIMGQMDAYLSAFRDGKKPGASLYEVRDAIKVAERLKGEVYAYHTRLKAELESPH